MWAWPYGPRSHFGKVEAYAKEPAAGTGRIIEQNWCYSDMCSPVARVPPNI